MPVNVARSYMAAEQLVGRDKIPMPKTPEEWDATYKRLGKPDTPDLYVLPVSTDAPQEILESLEKDATWFRGKAHELGLSVDQAAYMFESYASHVIDKQQQISSMNNENALNNEIALRTQFGAAYDGKMVLAERAVKELGGQEFLNLIEATGLNNDISFQRYNIKVGEMMAEELGLDKKTGALLQSHESLQDQISTIQKSPEYLDGTNPAHKAAVNKVAKLMEQLHPSGK